MNNFHNEFMWYTVTVELSIIVWLILYLISFTCYYLCTIKKRQRWLDRNVIINAFFIFYIISVISLTFTPIRIWNPDYRYYLMTRGGGTDLTIAQIANINLIPFRNLSFTIRFSTFRAILWGVGGNFIMLMPLPIFIGLRSNKPLIFKQALLFSFLTTLFIESTQLVLNLAGGWPSRLVCVDDLILNTLGALVGYAIFKKFPNLFEVPVMTLLKLLTFGK